MITEVIILAGGLGTRLREEVPDQPKCMAPVAGRPFLFHVINYLRTQGVTRFVFSLGYKSEVIISWLKVQYPTLDYDFVVETSPLGTGGAIRYAMEKCKEETVLVANGDTLFKVNIERLEVVHYFNRADCTIALKPMENYDRYGSVEITETGKIKNFREKKHYDSGFINGGIYLIERQAFLSHSYPSVFSFEKEYLERLHANIYGHPEDAYFIDIGVPEDYRRADRDLQSHPLDLSQIDKNWTLFIDRDGVINQEKKDDYIRQLSEFSFYPGVVEALKRCTEKFGKIIIVSNQRGVGRGLMSENDLLQIHHYLEAEVKAGGGRIDAVYYCTATVPTDPQRKPNPGMAFRALKEFPEIDLSRSLVLGNKPSDMLFGRFAGIYTVYIASTNPETPFPHPDIDLRFNSLSEFARAL